MEQPNKIVIEFFSITTCAKLSQIECSDGGSKLCTVLWCL